SLMDIRKRNPPSISTTFCSTPPASSRPAAPWVRLTNPAAIAASWSPRSRGRSREAASSKPSEETAIACATPVTSSVKLLSSQPMSCWVARVGAAPPRDPDGAVIWGLSPPVTFSLLYTSTPAAALAPTLDSPVVRGEQAANLLRGATLVGLAGDGRGRIYAAGDQLRLWHALGESRRRGTRDLRLGGGRGGTPATVCRGTPFRGHLGTVAVRIGHGRWLRPGWRRRTRARLPGRNRPGGLRHRVTPGPWRLGVATQIQ